MKKKFVAYLLSICLFVPCLLLTACGGDPPKAQFTIKTEITERDHIWVDNQFDKTITEGEDHEFNVYFSSGYLPRHLVVDINGVKVQNEGVLTYNDGTVITGEPDCTRTIIWTYTIENVSADQTIKIDTSACQLGNITVTLNPELDTNMKSYSTLMPTEGFVTALTSGVNMENVLSVQNNKFAVPYGSDILLFMDRDIERVNYNYTMFGGPTYTSESALTIYGEKYLQYSTSSVFLIKDANYNISIDSVEDDTSDTINEYDLLVNNIFSVMIPSEEIGGDVGIMAYSDSESYNSSSGTEPIEVEGTTLKLIGHYSGNKIHMYLGQGADASTDEYIVTKLEGEDTSAFTNNMYFQFTISNDAFTVHDFDFYLLESKDAPLTDNDKVTDHLFGIAQDQKAGYIKLTLQDAERFLSQKDTDNDQVNDTLSGGAYLAIVLKATAIEDKSIMQVDVAKYEDEYLAIYHAITNEEDVFVNRKESVTSYYFATMNNVPTMYVGAGVSASDKTSLRFSNARVVVYDMTTGTRQQIAEYPVEFLPTDENSKYVQLPILTTTESKKLQIVVYYTKQAYDTSSHTISFEHFDFDGKKLFVKTSLDAEWVEVNTTTNNIQIATGEKLYFYYEGVLPDYLKLVYNYVPETGGASISKAEMFNDLLNNTFGTDYNEYYIEIIDNYLDSGETIYMTK